MLDLSLGVDVGVAEVPLPPRVGAGGGRACGVDNGAAAGDKPTATEPVGGGSSPGIGGDGMKFAESPWGTWGWCPGEICGGADSDVEEAERVASASMPERRLTRRPRCEEVEKTALIGCKIVAWSVADTYCSLLECKAKIE